MAVSDSCLTPLAALRRERHGCGEAAGSADQQRPAGGLVKSNEDLVRAPDGAEVMELSNKG